MISLDTNEFKTKVKSATKDIFTSLSNKYKNLCGFSIYSDSDANSISAAFNKSDYFEKKCSEDEDEDKEYFRWYPPEWFKEGIPNEELDAISLNLLNAKYDDFDKHRQNIFKTIVDALVELREDGLFKSDKDDFVLVFYVSDYEDRKSEIRWIKCLNNENLIKRYEAWVKSWDE